jgi:hypothetical protein
MRILAFLALAVIAAPAVAQDAPRPMSLEQQMLLRCSAAFAIVAGEQQRGMPSARVYPPLAERGKEFFVRAGARLLDELQLSRAEIQGRLQAEVETLRAGSRKAGDGPLLESVMPPCLAALDASGV